MRIPYAMDVACEPGVLWPFLVETEKQKLWMKGLVENVPASEGPPGALRASTMRIKEGGRIQDYALIVTRYDEPVHLTVEMRGKAFGNGVMVVDYILTPRVGGTHLDYLCTFDAPGAGLAMRLMMGIGSLFAKRMLRRFLGTLKDLAEREAGTSLAA